MVEIKEKKEARKVGLLEEVEDWIKTKKGVSTRVKIDGSWFSITAKTAIQLQNIVAPLNLKENVEYGWRKSIYKGKEYYFITTINPVIQRTLENKGAEGPCGKVI